MGQYSYKWLPMDIADPPDIQNENVRANDETLEKSYVDLLKNIKLPRQASVITWIN